MKKSLLILLILSLLLLSGCSCSHEWTEASCSAPKTCALCGETEGTPLQHSWRDADCENPRTCTLCGEIQGEALGHLWQEATCETGETCSRCSKSQGEPLPHALGTLQKVGDTMFRKCSVCGWEESVPFAAEAYLQEKLVGTWICRSISQDSSDGSYHNEVICDWLDADTVTFRGDGTFTAQLGESKTGTWAYRETIENNGLLTYYCDLHYDGDGEDVIHSVSYSDDFGVSILEAHSTMVTGYHFQPPTPEMEAAGAHILGTWYSTMYITYELDPNSYAYEKDTITFDLDHSITFLEDGTLTAQFFGEKTGTWFCSNIYEGQYNTLYTYQIQFDGESQIYNCIYSYNIHSPNTGLDLNLDKDNKPVSYLFHPMTEAECLEYARAPELLSGSWASISAEYWSADAEEPTKEETDQYYLTFQPDGTFWGTLLTECRGKWEIDSYDPETGVYSYLIPAPGNTNYFYSVELRPDGTLSVLLYGEGYSAEILLKKQ